MGVMKLEPCEEALAKNSPQMIRTGSLDWEQNVYSAKSLEKSRICPEFGSLNPKVMPSIRSCPDKPVVKFCPGSVKRVP